MYLDILGQALLWTLEEALGRMWTPDVAMAWSKTFAMVQSGIMPGLLQACAEMEKDQETHQSIQQRADTSA